MIVEEAAYLKHYGVPGMTWEATRKQTLDRIYRVASGTASKRANMQKALKLEAKELAKKEKTVADESKPIKPSITEFLKQVGTVRMLDINPIG